MVSYVVWALVALAGYTLFTPLAEIATGKAPSHVVALVANGVLVAAAAGVTLARGDSVLASLTGEAGPYMLAAGACLAVGILAYYRALSLGSVSGVVPIFGTFVATSSVVGVAFLGESLSPRKGAGILLAVVAIYLTATG